jgi:spore coat protein U-like protein
MVKGKMKKYIIASLIILILNIALFHSIDAADTDIVTVNATVLSKSNCKFNSATAAIPFGTLDPSNPVDKTVSTSITFRCAGSSSMATFFISDDDGLYETGPNANRMKHSTIGTEYIPYEFTLNPTSGTVPKNTVQTLIISGTVNGTDYQNAATGTYSDTVVITLAP